jgi:CheY-like chemotaxis protein
LDIEKRPADRLVHQLGNLLGIAIGQAEYLLHDDGTTDPVERQECLSSIRQSVMEAREALHRLHRLIRVAGDPGLTAAGSPWAATGAGAAAPTPSRVLVIEDQDELRDVIATILTGAGHDVETAASGVEGVELYQRERFDCVVTDFGMPGLNGLTVSRIIKDHDPNAYVVLMTGAEPLEEELRAAGIDRVLLKPLNGSEMSRLVARHGRVPAAGGPCEAS